MAQVRKSRRRTPAGPRGLRQDSFKRLAAGENLHLYGSLPDPDPPSEIVPFDIVGEWSERAAGNPEERENVECLPFTTGDVEALLDLIVSARNSEIVRRYCSDEETLKSIGDRLRLSRERVRQIARQGLREIRTKLQAKITRGETERILERTRALEIKRTRIKRAKARDEVNRTAWAARDEARIAWAARAWAARDEANRTAREARRIAYEIEYAARTARYAAAAAAARSAKTLAAHAAARATAPYRRLANELAIARADERTARSTGRGIEAAIACTHKAETAYAEAFAALRLGR